MPWPNSWKFFARFLREIRDVTTSEVVTIVISVGVAIAWLINSFVQGDKSWITTLIDQAPIWVTVACCFGCYFTIKTAHHLHGEDVSVWQNYAPIIYGDDRRPMRPHGWKWGRVALVLCAVFVLIAAVPWFLKANRNTVTLVSARQEPPLQPHPKLPHDVSPRPQSVERQPVLRTAPRLNLIFKASPLFTDATKQRVASDLESFYAYLTKLGFDVPKDLPLIEVVPGRTQGSALDGGGSVYDSKFIIGVDRLDDRWAVDLIWANYVFSTLFEPHFRDTINDDRLFLDNTAWIFSRYFTDSFHGKRERPVTTQWGKALWDIRQKQGRDYADRALFYTFKTFRARKPQETDFNKFVLDRFLHGVYIVDNFNEGHAATAAILKAHGLNL